MSLMVCIPQGLILIMVSCAFSYSVTDKGKRVFPSSSFQLTIYRHCFIRYYMTSAFKKKARSLPVYDRFF